MWRVFLIALAGLCGCMGTPKVSRWSAPEGFGYAQVFDASLRAGTAEGLTVVSSDRQAGTISLRRSEVGETNASAERRLSVRVKDDGGSVSVATRAEGSDAGLIEGALGGVDNQNMTKNFYVYLFRELKIVDPAYRNIWLEDER